MDALERARSRGVEVRVLSDHIAQADNAIPCST